MTSHLDSINQAVAQQYNAFPFPDYGLLLPLRWQEAYASHSSFAHKLYQEASGAPHERPKGGILIAGCGDVFPSIAQHWEPSSFPRYAIDLSETNLKRAKWRCWPRLKSCSFHRLNLDLPLPFPDESFSHIDSYGVLHHLANPAQGLAHLSAALAKGGTLRLMVYNRKSRDWIHQIQKIYALLDLSPFDKTDRTEALRFLEHLARECPALNERLLTMLPQLRSKPSRLVDTFLHAREAKLELDVWLEAFLQNELKVVGLFDRYAELDDLPNPLYHFPSETELEQRCVDRRFENNWEIFLIKDGPVKAPTTAHLPNYISLRSPPKAWFSYSETKSIRWIDQRTLWSIHLSGYSGQTQLLSSKLIKSLGELGIKRLLRIGAIWPSSLPSELADDFQKNPIHPFMEPPQLPHVTPLREMPASTAFLQTILLRKAKHPQLLALIAKRLEAAQRPSSTEKRGDE